MDFLSLVLPLALFVITMVIILVLRAEDKKSRSLQTVKEKISLFRSESQQTVARINEAAKDASERVEVKKNEVYDLVTAVDQSLSNLANHKSDLVSLESVCRGYELALDKLRVQTDHAEDRIRTVKAQVEEADRIQQIVQDFRAEVDAVHQSLEELTVTAQKLVEKTEGDLNAIAEAHKAKADELAGQFAGMLADSRQDFDSYIDSVRSDLECRQDDFKSYLDDSLTTFDGKRDEYHSLSEEAMKSLEEARAAIQTASSEAGAALEVRRGEIDRSAQEATETIRRQKEALEEERSAHIDAMKEAADGFTSSLDASFGELTSRLSSQQEDFSRFQSASREELARLEADLDGHRKAVEEGFEEHRKSFDAELESMLEEKRTASSQLQDEVREAFSGLRTSLETEKGAFSSTLAANRAEIEDFLKKASDSLSVLEGRKNQIEAHSEDAQAKADEVFRALEDRVDELSSASQRGIADTIREGEDNLSHLATQLEERLKEASSSMLSTLDKARDDFNGIHEENRKRVEDDEAAFADRCRGELASVLDAELGRVSRSYDAMMEASTEQLGNFARKLTEIKEAVSMLNQGVNESLARAGEKLGQMQGRMSSSEASLAETQNKVTVAKEELFNLQKEHKSLVDELAKTRKELEWLQGKAQSAKRERQNEEARLVKLQMEAANKAAKSAPAPEPAPAASSETFVGDEEEIPLDED